MRAAIRERANRLFVSYPAIGRLGYDFLRLSGLDRSTRGVRDYFKNMGRRGFQPRVILDIGANYGGWSREVRAVFNDARFFLIEPQEEMAPFLDQFVSRSPGSKWFLGGAGAVEGQSALTLWSDLQGSAFLSPELEDRVPYRHQRTVPVFTVDGLVNDGEMPLPDLVKIDVQGFELEVLRGCIGCLGKSDLFIVETSFLHPLGRRPNYYRVVEFMEAYGYPIVDFMDFKYRPGDGALWQVDICFARPGAFPAQSIPGSAN